MVRFPRSALTLKLNTNSPARKARPTTASHHAASRTNRMKDAIDRSPSAFIGLKTPTECSVEKESSYRQTILSNVNKERKTFEPQPIAGMPHRTRALIPAVGDAAGRRCHAGATDYRPLHR